MLKFNIQQSLSFANNNIPSYQKEDFIRAENNKDAYVMVTNWPDLWQEKCLFINAPSSGGKTHLASIWQKSTDAFFVSYEDLTAKNIQQIIELVNGNNIIIEDFDKLDDFDSQEKVFHLYNHVVNNDKYILITSSAPILSIKFWFNDLKSRLLASVSVNIKEPGDDMMRAIFTKLFSDLQLKVSIDVIEYLIPRLERNFISAKKIVELIDKKSIEMKRAVTIPFIKEILKNNL